jgi:alkylated DNA repair protein alkB family protein 6
MAIDFKSMIAHERQKKKQREKEAAQQTIMDVDSKDCIWEDVALVPHSLSSDFGELHYLGEFLSSHEASQLEQAILTQHRSAEWLSLPKRRLLNLGGVPHPNGMISESLPSWLDPLLRRLKKVGVFPEDVVPNQVLLNRYDVGDGIDPHADGPLFEPYVAIISLQSSALIQFLEPPAGLKATGQNSARLAASWDALGPAAATVLLQPRSLFAFSGEAYTDFLHGISSSSQGQPAADHIDCRCLNVEQAVPQVAFGDVVQRGPRLSLTIRAVRNVAVPAGEYITEAQSAEVQRRRAWWARAVSERV